MRKALIFALLFGFMLCGTAQAEDSAQKVFRAGSRPSTQVKAENFTGKAWSDPVFQSPAPARAYGAFVTFAPGSRTNWHTHPLGQTLLVTSGKGITQEWGQEPTIILPGDVIVCPPNVKHWHGAVNDTGMTHLAISERGEKPVEWVEKVNDAEYAKSIKMAGGR